MRRFFHKLLSFWCAATFLGGSLALGLGVFPLLFLVGIFDRKAHKRRCTRLIGWGYGTFLTMIRVLSLVTSNERFELPEQLAGKPYIVIANHPSLIDVLFLLSWLPGSTCVVKGSWKRNIFFGPLLRSTNYIGSDEPSDESSMTGALDRMVEHVQAGFPLIIFPEGTRSGTESLRRFRRGAFEVAARTGVPILPIFIGVSQPFLKKGMPVLALPDEVVRYEINAWPVVEPGDDPKALLKEFDARYRAEFADWVAHRKRLATAPSLPAPANAASDAAE